MYDVEMLKKKHQSKSIQVHWLLTSLLSRRTSLRRPPLGPLGDVLWDLAEKTTLRHICHTTAMILVVYCDNIWMHSAPSNNETKCLQYIIYDVSCTFCFSFHFIIFSDVLLSALTQKYFLFKISLNVFLSALNLNGLQLILSHFSFTNVMSL